jgi:hypothetical protein
MDTKIFFLGSEYIYTTPISQSVYSPGLTLLTISFHKIYKGKTEFIDKPKERKQIVQD